MTEAQLEGAKFGESPMLNDREFMGTCTYSPDGRSFIACTVQEVILYNTSTWVPNSLKNYGKAHPVCTTFSPDSSMLATGGADGTLDLWDVESGDHRHKLQGHHRSLRNLVFSSQRQTLLSSSTDHSVRLWDVQSGHALDKLCPEGRGNWAVMDITFSSDGNPLAAYTRGNSLEVWDVSSGRRLFRSNVEQVDTKTEVKQALFSPSGQYLSVYQNIVIEICDSQSGSLLQTLKLDGAVFSTSFSPTGNLFAVLYKDGRVQVYDPRTGEPYPLLKGHYGGVYCVAFSLKEEQITTVGEDMTVRLWDTQTGTQGPVISGHAAPVRHVAYSPDLDQRKIASRDSEGTIRLWDVPDSVTASRQVIKRHNSSVVRVICMPGGRYYLSYCSNLLIIRERDPKFQISLQCEQSISALASSPDGCQFALACSDRTVRLRETLSGDIMFTLEMAMEEDEEEEDFQEILVEYSSNGALVASSVRQGIVKIWDCCTGRLVHSLLDTDSNSPVSRLLFSPNGDQTLATASKDRTIRIWDVASGQCVQKLEKHQGSPKLMAFSSDGSQFTMFSSNRTLYRWDIDTSKLIHPVVKTGCQRALALTPGGTHLIGASLKSGGDLRVWGSSEEKARWTLGTFGGSGVVAALSSTGQMLASYDKSGFVRVFNIMEEEVGRTRPSRVVVTCLAWCNDTSLVMGDVAGDITVWVLKQNGTTATDREVAGSTSGGGHDLMYDFELLWTTAYCKLNAEGAVIQEAKVSSANAKLLKQIGAKGQPKPPLSFKQLSRRILTMIRVSRHLKEESARRRKQRHWLLSQYSDKKNVLYEIE